MGISRCLSSKNRIRREVTIFTRTMNPGLGRGFFVLVKRPDYIESTELGTILLPFDY